MDTKVEFITIVGCANAGKSSLLNALVGEKIAMVSNKPQTTRTRITGLVTEEKTQYVFMENKKECAISTHSLSTIHLLIFQEYNFLLLHRLNVHLHLRESL